MAERQTIPRDDRKEAGMKKPEGRRPETFGAVRIREIETTSGWKVQAEWRDPADPKKRRYHKLNNWRAAREWARAKDKELSEDKPAAASVKFGKAWLAFMESLKERYQLGFVRRQTFDNDLHAEKRILKEFEHKVLSTIEPMDIEEWVRKMQLSGLGPRTVRRRVGLVRRFFDFCIKRKKKYGMLHNPVRAEPVVIEGKTKRRDVSRVHDMELYEQFLKGPRPALYGGKAEFWPLSWANRYVMFALCAGAGLRPNEAAALKWEAVNLSLEWIGELPGLHLHVDEEMGNNTRYGVSKPKTESSARDVPICQWVYDTLVDQMRLVGKPQGFVLKKVDGWGGSKEAFNRDRVFQMHRTGMRAAGIVKEDGKTIRFTLHQLRHFYPSIRIEMGHNITAIAEALGHKGSAMTLDVYSHNFKPGELTQFWIDRFQPALVDTPRLLNGQATVIDDGVPMITGPTIEGAATEIEDLIKIPPGATITIRNAPRLPGGVYIPQPVPQWVHEAVRLINGGWRLPDILDHLRQHRTTVLLMFRRLGLPPPADCIRMVRDARIDVLANEQGYLDSDIARMVGASEDNVRMRRLAMLRAEDDNHLENKNNPVHPYKSIATRSRDDQLKLL